MRRRIVVALIALVALATASRAARDDDYDFAKGLVDKKLYDLAKEQFENIINDGSRTPEARADGELGLAFLLKAQVVDATRSLKPPIEEILAAFESAEAGFDGFLDRYPNHPRVLDAKFEVGVLRQNKGTYLTARMEDDPGLKEELTPKAESAFEEAIDLFQSAMEGLQQQLDRGGLTDDETARIEWDLARAGYLHAVAHYYKGRLYDPGSDAREDVLEQAAKLLEDFAWDHEEDILGGYTFLFQGLVYKEMDRPDESLEWLSNAYSSRVPDRDSDPDLYMTWTDLFLQAYYKLCEYCNALGERTVRDAEGEEQTLDYRRRAVTAIKEMRERIPDHEDRRFGHFALLEYAKALKGLGDFSEALSIATHVSEKADALKAQQEWALGTAFLANKLLNEIIAEAGLRGVELGLAPETLFKAAEGKKAERKWPQAVRAFQKVIQSCQGEAPDVITQFAVPSWMLIGECYYRREQFLEAYYVYDHVVSLFRETNEDAAGEASYYCYRAATALFATTGDPYDGERKKRARKKFAEEYPKHPRSIDLQYFEGSDTIKDADAKAESSDPALRAKAKELYQKAIDKFLVQVGDESVLYEKARARIGEVEYKLERYDAALKEFKWVLSYEPKTKITRDDHRSHRYQAKAIATYYGALCHTELDDWAEAIVILAGFEETFNDPELQKNFLPPVMFTRIQAYMRTGDLEKMEAEVLSLRGRFPDRAQVPLALQLLGRANLEKANEIRAKFPKGDRSYVENPDYRRYLGKAAQYYSEYVETKAEPDAVDYASIGFWFKDLGELPLAEENLKNARVAYEKLLALTDERDRQAVETIRKKLESIYYHLSRILITQALENPDKYTEARDLFEKLLARGESPGEKKASMEAARKLLMKPDFNTDDLATFNELVRNDPGLLEGLARIYMEIGTRDELHRAQTLLAILRRTHTTGEYRTYGDRWWNWQLMTFQVWLKKGVKYREEQPLRNIEKKFVQYEDLGLMKRNKLSEEFKRILAAAKDELLRQE